MPKYMRIALKLTKKSNHDQYRLGAVIVRGGAVVSTGCNLERRTFGHLPTRGRCAEARALVPHIDFKGCEIYVARAGGRMSRPCKRCLSMLKKAGIVRFFYFDWDGSIKSEKVKNKVK